MRITGTLHEASLERTDLSAPHCRRHQLHHRRTPSLPRTALRCRMPPPTFDRILPPAMHVGTAGYLTAAEFGISLTRLADEMCGGRPLPPAQETSFVQVPTSYLGERLVTDTSEAFVRTSFCPCGHFTRLAVDEVLFSLDRSPTVDHFHCWTRPRVGPRSQYTLEWTASYAHVWHEELLLRCVTRCGICMIGTHRVSLDQIGPTFLLWSTPLVVGRLRPGVLHPHTAPQAHKTLATRFTRSLWLNAFHDGGARRSPKPNLLRTLDRKSSLHSCSSSHLPSPPSARGHFSKTPMHSSNDKHFTPTPFATATAAPHTGTCKRRSHLSPTVNTHTPGSLSLTCQTSDTHAPTGSIRGTISLAEYGHL